MHTHNARGGAEDSTSGTAQVTHKPVLQLSGLHPDMHTHKLLISEDLLHIGADVTLHWVGIDTVG